MPEPLRPRQLPLDLDSPPRLSRDDFIAGSANAAALALVEAWPDWPSVHVVIAGPPGAGKSHLAAIWRERCGATALAPSALGGDALAAMRRGPVVLDDADAPGLDETGLFHLLNEARGEGHHVLMTARRFPAAWGVRLPDLASRLRAAATVELHEPDDLLLAAVMTKLFADRQVEVEPNVVQYLVRRIERSLATANAVVQRLDRRALEEGTRISRQLAARVLDAMDQGQKTLDL